MSIMRRGTPGCKSGSHIAKAPNAAGTLRRGQDEKGRPTKEPPLCIRAADGGRYGLQRANMSVAGLPVEFLCTPVPFAFIT
jgi:hypothetical protein